MMLCVRSNGWFQQPVQNNQICTMCLSVTFFHLHLSCCFVFTLSILQTQHDHQNSDKFFPIFFILFVVNFANTDTSGTKGNTNERCSTSTPNQKPNIKHTTTDHIETERIKSNGKDNIPDEYMDYFFSSSLLLWDSVCVCEIPHFCLMSECVWYWLKCCAVYGHCFLIHFWLLFTFFIHNLKSHKKRPFST